MRRVDVDADLSEGPGIFCNRIGWTAALSVPFKPSARSHLGQGRDHSTAQMMQWKLKNKTCIEKTMAEEKCWMYKRRKNSTTTAWWYNAAPTFSSFSLYLRSTHTHRHATAQCLGRHILPWWSWLRGLHLAHADGCWGTLPLPWWMLAGGHSHCHGDDGRNQACQPMKWWIDAKREAKGKRD